MRHHGAVYPLLGVAYQCTELFVGLLEGQPGFIVGGGAMIMSAGVGGAIVGLPLPLMPCPLIGAAGAALYYDSHQLRYI